MDAHAAADDRARLLAMLAALPAEAPRASAVLRASDDPRRTLGYAFRHGVLPYLACHLGATAPDDLRGYLRETEETRALSHAVGLRALGVALDALAAKSVAAIALKGPLLGARLYDPPFARPSLDLDLLVRPKDFSAAQRALRDASWHDAPGTDAAASLRRHHHVQLVSDVFPSVELHFAATSSFGTRIEADSLFDRARTVCVQGVRAQVPASEDEVAYLATHAAAHHVERLGWIYDLALLLRTSLDLPRILERAAELRVRRVTHAMLALAAEAFAVPIHLPPLDRLQRRALATLPRFDDPRASELTKSVARAAFIALLADTPANGLRHLRKKAAMRWRRAWPNSQHS